MQRLSHLPAGLDPPGEVEAVAALQEIETEGPARPQAGLQMGRPGPTLLPESRLDSARSGSEPEATVQVTPRVGLLTWLGDGKPGGCPQDPVLPEGRLPIQPHQNLMAAVGPCRGQ